MRETLPAALRLTAALSVALGIAPASDFVLTYGGVLRPGVRLDDFEMAGHPVTNAEYKVFVDAAKYPAPFYWKRETSTSANTMNQRGDSIGRYTADDVTHAYLLVGFRAPRIAGN